MMHDEFEPPEPEPAYEAWQAEQRSIAQGAAEEAAVAAAAFRAEELGEHRPNWKTEGIPQHKDGPHPDACPFCGGEDFSSSGDTDWCEDYQVEGSQCDSCGAVFSMYWKQDGWRPVCPPNEPEPATINGTEVEGFDTFNDGPWWPVDKDGNAIGNPPEVTA